MFGHYRRALLCVKHNPITVIPTPFSLLLHSFTTSSKQQHSFTFTFSYLVKTCGFSPQTASKLSTRLRLDDSHDPDSVIALFTTHGFSKPQTRAIIQTYPNLLAYNAHKTLLPKLTFLRSKGASNPDLVRILTKNPKILRFALDAAIAPCYDLIQKFTLSDESTLRAIKSCPSVVYSKNPARNIQTLLENGVPESKVAMLLRNWASSLVADTTTFKSAVGEVKQLGFGPNRTLFIIALRAKLVRKSLWEKKIEVYGKWGWSEEVVVSTFLRNPWCMLASEGKIEAMMEFCVNHLGWDSLFLARHPVVIAMSLEKRIIPRAFVLQFLLSEGLVKDVNWASAFIASEQDFLRRFVVCFQGEASQLLRMYEDKRDAPR